MNETERQLIDLLLDGALPEADGANLLTRIEGDGEAVAYLADRALLHRDLRQSLKRREVQQWATAALSPQTPRAMTPASRWFAWRPVWAAAAGLAIGLFSASLVFGYVMPRAVATASRLFALVDGSFEKATGRLPSGFPDKFGVWSGDESEVVSGTAQDGKHALRFVRAEREPTLPNYGAASCDVYQLVDLRSLKADASSGEAMLELSVQFLDARDSAGEPVKFISQLLVFAGSPEALPAEWPLPQKDALATGSSYFDSTGGSPRSWHQVTAKVLLPPQADFAVVHLVAHKPKALTGADALFGSQFADDVRLTMKTQPTLPVRLAKR